MTITLQRTYRITLLTALLVLLGALPAAAHEEQVIEFGSFLGGLLHPVLGLDHFLAMVSVGHTWKSASPSSINCCFTDSSGTILKMTSSMAGFPSSK